MTQEEKSKLYDEALKKAKMFYKDEHVDDEVNSLLEVLFPELKDSEDEKIRKEITSILHNAYWTSNKDRFNELVAWLEKQGEQKQDPCNNCKDVRLNCHNFPCVKKRAFKQGKSVLEVINEENVDNANKVQPKQEWSEEDKVILDEIIDFFENGTVKLQHDLSLYASWLKSLRPQSTWKPTEKQINAIRLARSFVTDDFGNTPTLSEVLKELEKQLKKLK